MFFKLLIYNYICIFCHLICEKIMKMCIIACEKKYIQNLSWFPVYYLSKPILITKYKRVSHARFVKNQEL